MVKPSKVAVGVDSATPVVGLSGFKSELAGESEGVEGGLFDGDVGATKCCEAVGVEFIHSPPWFIYDMSAKSTMKRINTHDVNT